MKNILIYGDSNAYGYISGTIDDKTLWCERFPINIRWPSIIEEGLKDCCTVITEGLPGRTIAEDDPESPGRNGIDYLIPCLLSHRPLDLIIVMLGTNDMKPVFHLTATKIIANLALLCKTIETNYVGNKGTNPLILIIAPPEIHRNKLSEKMRDRFKGAEQISPSLSSLYKTLCEKNGYFFYDASYLTCGETSDGIHLDQAAHQHLGNEILKKVKEILHNG